MATYYAVSGGGNWTSGSTWSTVSAKDASRVGDGSTPTSSDDCIVDDYSGNVTLDSASCNAKSVDFTGHTGTFTLTNFTGIAVYGSLTFSSGMTISVGGSSTTITIAAAGTVTSAGKTIGIGTLALQADVTLNTNGTTWTNITIIGGNRTITLTSALQVTKLDVTQNYSNTTFAGNYAITVGTLEFGYGGGVTLTLVSGQTMTITSGIKIFCNTNQRVTIKASTASSAAYIAYTGADKSAVSMCGAIFTDIDFSTYSTPVTSFDNWYGGTLTRTSGITNRTSADIGGGTGGVTGRCQQIGFGVC